MHKYSDPLLTTLLKHLWQWLQPQVFLGMMLQAWHICIWGVSPILLCRFSQALSGWIGSVAAQLFSLQRCLIGFKFGLLLGHSWTFRHLSRSHSCVSLAVCLGSLSCWKVNLHPSRRSWALWSRCSSRISLYFAPFIFPSILTSLPVPAAEKHWPSMMLPPPCFTVGMMPGFLQTWPLAFKPRSSILISSDKGILFLMVWESVGAFWQAPSGLSCAFYWGVAFVCPLYHKGVISGVLQRWLSIWKVLPSPQRNSGALSEWPSGSWSPPWPTPFFPDWQGGLAGRPALGRVLIVPNIFHLRMMGATVFLATFKCCRNVLVPLPRSVPRHNPVLELYRQFLRRHGLVFALMCTVNCGTLYRQMCAFPNHVQSIEFTTGGLKDDQLKQDAPELNFKYHCKGSEYLCK